jgi:hypothetical protein
MMTPQTAQDIMRNGYGKRVAPDSNAWGDARFGYERADRVEKQESKPNFVLADPEPETECLTVLIDDQNKMLRIMSNAGYYIKDVARDRTVDGAFVTYTFTKRVKKEVGVAYELEE